MEELDCNCSVETLLLRRRIDISLLRLGAWKRGMNYTTQLISTLFPIACSHIHRIYAKTQDDRVTEQLASSCPWRHRALLMNGERGKCQYRV